MSSVGRNLGAGGGKFEVRFGANLKKRPNYTLTFRLISEALDGACRYKRHMLLIFLKSHKGDLYIHEAQWPVACETIHCPATQTQPPRPTQKYLVEATAMNIFGFLQALS